MTDRDGYIARLAEGWRSSGVSEGDILLVHSSIKRTLVTARRQGVKLSPADILESFLQALGPDGTLILPLFNFDFPTSKIFDLRNTPSQMGALTEIGRTREGSIRTGHPIYSFAVLGHRQDMFAGVNNESGYGEDSPFGILHRASGKIASLDLDDQNSMTFYHYVEEHFKVNYRYFKEFVGEYTDLDGVSSTRRYKLFVRDVENEVHTHVNPAGEKMWDQGVYSGSRAGEGTGLRTVTSGDMFDLVADLIQKGEAEGNLFVYGNAS